MKTQPAARDSEQPVARFLAQFSTTNCAEAIHLALQALRARVEPDRVLAVSWPGRFTATDTGVGSADPTARGTTAKRPIFETSSGSHPGAQPTSGSPSDECS